MGFAASDRRFDIAFLGALLGAVLTPEALARCLEGSPGGPPILQDPPRGLEGPKNAPKDTQQSPSACHFQPRGPETWPPAEIGPPVPANSSTSVGAPSQQELLWARMFPAV
eukprot:3909651-Pyramimonas_sp.AAC.1